MGCFPACFSHWRHKQTMKNVQQQCLSPIDELHESAKLLPATVKEEDIVNPINLDNGETAVSDLNKGSNDDDDDKLDRIEKKSTFVINDKEKEITFVQEESCDSLFSLSIDSRKQVYAVDVEDKEVNSSLLAKTGEIAASLKCDEDKENVSLSKDPIIKQSYGESKKQENEIAVDTSLSSWLVASEKSNKKTSMDSSPQSEKNYGGREILGAITSATEFKEVNGILSGGSTPCCSADDQPGIGTVGGYWRRRGLFEPQRCVDCLNGGLFV